MSENYKFDVDELDDNENITVGDTPDNSEVDIPDNIGTGLVLLPFSVVAMFAFVEEATLLSAMETLFGDSLLALSVTKGFWVVGAVIATILALGAVITAVNLLAAVIKRSPENATLGLLGGVYFVAGWTGATFLFGGVPLLVGFILTTNLIIYGGIVVVGFIAVLATTISV